MERFAKQGETEVKRFGRFAFTICDVRCTRFGRRGLRQIVNYGVRSMKWEEAEDDVEVGFIGGQGASPKWGELAEDGSVGVYVRNILCGFRTTANGDGVSRVELGKRRGEFPSREAVGGWTGGCRMQGQRDFAGLEREVEKI